MNATLCDAGNPCVWVPAEQLGCTGSELSDEINENDKLIDTVREIRGRAAVLMGLTQNWDRVDEQSPGLPMVGMVAAPADYRTLSRASVNADAMDLRVRLIFMNRLHESIAGTGSICLAAASRVTGSTVAALAEHRQSDQLLIGHPSGITPTKVSARAVAKGEPSFTVLGFSRTARRLMKGTAYRPPIEKD